MGPDDIYEEPRAAAEPRLVSKVHDQASEPQPSEAAFVGRTFIGRWNLNRGLGLAEELSCQGWQRRRRWRELPQREAQERHPCEHERSGEPSLPQGGGAGGGALLHWAGHPGEPQ